MNRPDQNIVNNLVLHVQLYFHLTSISCQSPSASACNNDYQINIMLLLLLTETLQMPKSKGDQRIWGLLAQSVEQVKKKSGKVENARTVRQREKDRLARLRGAELESATSAGDPGENLRAPVHRNEDSFTGESGVRSRAGAELGSMGEEVNRQDVSLRIASHERQGGKLARKEDSQVEQARADTQRERRKLTRLVGEGDGVGTMEDRDCRTEKQKGWDETAREEANQGGGESGATVRGESLVKGSSSVLNCAPNQGLDEREVDRPLNEKKSSKRKKKTRSSCGKLAVDIYTEAEDDDIIEVEVEKKPIEVIDIEEYSCSGEENLMEEKDLRERVKKKKKKAKRKKREKENEARFFKNPLFEACDQEKSELSRSKPDVDDQSEGNSELPGSNHKQAEVCERLSSLKSIEDVGYLESENLRERSLNCEKFSSIVSQSVNERKNVEGSESNSHELKSMKGAIATSMKKTYKAGGKKKRFTHEEDAIILRSYEIDGEELDYTSLAKKMERSHASVKTRLLMLKKGDIQKRHTAFTLLEDKAIIDMVFPYQNQALEGQVPSWEWLKIAEEMSQRRSQTLRSRWEHYLKPWLLQDQAGTLNLNISSLLMSHLVSSYSSIDAIVWSEVAKIADFRGHTEASLRGMFYSKLLKGAAGALGKGKHLVTLREVAEVHSARVERETKRNVRERQEELIKYWGDKKKTMELMDSLLQEQKSNLLSARQEEQKKKGLSTEEVVEQRKVRQKRTTLPKKTEKKVSQKRQFESLPRLDHKHNAGSTKLADIYNLDEPVLYQVRRQFKHKSSDRVCFSGIKLFQVSQTLQILPIAENYFSSC